jgi:hypothetical protein
MAEASLRLDGGSDHDERGAHVLRGVGDRASELTRPRAHDLSVRTDPVALGQRALTTELDSKCLFLTVEMSVKRQLPVDKKGRQQEDARAPIGGEPASKIERMTGVLLVQERDDDHPVSAGKASGCPAEAAMASAEPVPREQAA